MRLDYFGGGEDVNIALKIKSINSRIRRSVPTFLLCRLIVQCIVFQTNYIADDRDLEAAMGHIT
jgi:hypothetical protein